LFFASLLLGALGDQLFALGLNAAWPGLNVDADSYAIMGMCALSVSVIGGPLTMTFIALETTGDLWLTTEVLIAAIIAGDARIFRIFVRHLAVSYARRDYPRGR
jgi:CIC family chloride channel protein